jgi:hypothetical protein
LHVEVGNKNGQQKKMLGKETLCCVVLNVPFGGLKASSVFYRGLRKEILQFLINFFETLPPEQFF